MNREPGSLRRTAARKGGGQFVGDRVGLSLALCLLVLPLSPLRAEDTPPSTVTGEAARDKIVGNTLDGTTADGPYTLFVAGDGRLVSTDRDGRAEGTWVFRDGKLCAALPDEDEECRSLEVTGPVGAFVDSDGSRYPFTITTGNPKKL